MSLIVDIIAVKPNNTANCNNFNLMLKNLHSFSNNVFVLSADESDKILPNHYIYNTDKDAVTLCKTIAEKAQGDVLLLNGASLQADDFAELQKVLYSTERHMAVSPRGFNMGLLSVPFQRDLPYNLTLEESRNCYNEIKPSLPPYHIIPYPTSACVLIKGKLIKKFGFFDEFSGNIEDALISWSLKINGYGYSCVAANGVFIEHTCSVEPISKSFERKYPFIKKYYDDYTLYFLPLFDRFAPVISNKGKRKPRLLLSLYQLIPAYNGTSEHAFGIAERFVKKYSDKYEIHILITKETADFFNVYKKFSHIVYPDTITGVYDLGITFTQIYFTDLLTILNRHCLKIISTVLDLISFRCGYFAVLTDSLIFKKSVEYSDGIITISHFSKNDLSAAFPDIKEMPQIHPIHIGIATHKDDVFLNQTHKPQLPYDKFILVFGNYLKHKALENIIHILPNLDFNFIVIGCRQKKEYKNIKCYSSGGLSSAFIEALYSKCLALIYPSEYEGFGLPVVHALKYGKKVIVSRTEVNCELQEIYRNQKDNFIFFDTYGEIEGILKTHDFESDTAQNIHIRNYDEITEETENFIEIILNAPIDEDKLSRRNDVLLSVEHGTQSLRNLIKEHIKKKYPKLFKILRKVYKMSKSFIGRK